MSVNDGGHYLIDSAAPSAPPTAVFRGHSSRNFFVKAAFSPDDTHLLSGSANCCAYIWQVGDLEWFGISRQKLLLLHLLSAFHELLRLHLAGGAVFAAATALIE